MYPSFGSHLFIGVSYEHSQGGGKTVNWTCFQTWRFTDHRGSPLRLLVILWGRKGSSHERDTEEIFQGLAKATIISF